MEEEGEDKEPFFSAPFAWLSCDMVNKMSLSGSLSLTVINQTLHIHEFPPFLFYCMETARKNQVSMLKKKFSLSWEVDYDFFFHSEE